MFLHSTVPHKINEIYFKCFLSTLDILIIVKYPQRGSRVTNFRDTILHDVVGQKPLTFSSTS